MREIKYRFWTGEKMIMPEEFADVFIKGDGNIYVCHDLGHDISIIHDVFTQANQLIPMQYTGMKDRNGKEIYEGDIVKTPRRDQFVMTYNERSGYHYGSYGDSAYYWTVDYNEGDEDEFEVIGNIYENPEIEIR